MGRKIVRWGLVLVVLVALGVLGIYQLRHPPRLPAVPLELTTRAVIPGIPGARYFVTADLDPFVQDVVAARQREEAAQASSGQAGELGSFDFLAVSGGGDNGAFGAGLLCGWSDAGNRPTFKAVTGVSTGALIAPFAFLGPEYDHVLRTVYTSVRPTDISARRNFLAAINNDGMADNRPLWSLISKFVNEDFLKKTAAEYGKGRFLLIGTTNLDTRIPVIWNMGAIASSGDPRALEVFRNILVASAAIPGAFPPTMMRVEADGKPYDEMHVDGGASSQVFMYPPRLRATAAEMGIKMNRTGRVYVIRNASLRPEWVPVERQTINIAGRAIASLIHTQGLGDLNRIYLQTQQDGLDFNLAIIGPEFQHEHKEEFDTAYMQALFDYAYNLSKPGYPWKKTPPGFDAPANR